MTTADKSSPWWRDERFVKELRRREAASQPSQDQIRRLAYEIYLRRKARAETH